MRVLVTGGAGYIGSVITTRLLESGHAVTVFDDLSRGHRAVLPPGAALVVADIRDERAIKRALAQTASRAVIHMAALAEVAESVEKPALYADVNVGGTQALASAARAAGVDRIVFSSTAAVYGAPDRVPIGETADLRPANPYGKTKLAAEEVLFAAAAEGAFAVAALRYFNACGAYGACGEDHRPESHLIPLALRAARDGGVLQVYGDDYPTPDGTCVRDYVHVTDLADAHIAALDALPGCAGPMNLGTATGDSVLQVLRTIEEVTGRPVARRVDRRRPGDPPSLVAANDRALTALGWRPRRTVRDAVRDAWQWMGRHPDGYAGRQGLRST
jgi:UDP-glucose 4-epimerase